MTSIRRFVFPLCLAFAAAFAASTPARAEAAAPIADTVRTGHATSTLAPTHQGVAPGETVWFVLRQELEEGWHVYWRNPGDSGLPLDLAWSLPQGFIAGEPLYPTPERIPVGPFVNFGHHGAPVFLAPVTAPADAALGETALLELTATWLICEEICVPETGVFALDMPVVDAPPPNGGFADVAASFRAAAPQPFPGEAIVEAGEDGPRLTLTGGPIDRAALFFFPYQEGVVEPAAPQTFKATADGRTARFVPGPTYDAAKLDGLPGVLKVGDGDAAKYYLVKTQAMDDASAGAGAPAPRLSAEAGGGGGALNRATPGGLTLLFLAAFFGGALLNLMPCVFPILFVKAASLVSAASADRAAMRRHGLLYGAGVVATFAALGGTLLALRAGGAELGWGFHLQSPPVVALSAIVLFAVGLNLAGVFEIGLGLQGVGGGGRVRHGEMGAFLTGVLAVFVAAPCIGPLLSAPVGAAALLPPVAGMTIFILMALGLAAPYAAVSFSPALARALPRPGPWMAVFKQALSFPVFAAAAFFVWVLAQQTGAAGLARMLAALVALAAAAWAFGLAQGRTGAVWRVAAAVLLLGGLAPLASVSSIAGAANAGAKPGYGPLEATAWDPAALEAARADGRGVFVDFTAAWCVTCQFNKATVLSRPSLADVFERHDVMLMAADWTRRDPAVTRALEAFGANGVPLYVYYPPDGGAPHVLPLPLTERAIVGAVETGARMAAN